MKKRAQCPAGKTVIIPTKKEEPRIVKPQHYYSVQHPKNAHKNVQKSCKNFKPSIHNTGTNFQKYGFLCAYWMCSVPKVLQ